MASSAKERFHTFNTLSVLLIAMHGRKVVVETTNDSTITGKVMQSDGFGNLWLANATLATINGKKTRFHEIHVKGSRIRFVHLPDDVDPMRAIHTELNRLSKRKNIPPKIH